MSDETAMVRLEAELSFTITLGCRRIENLQPRPEMPSAITLGYTKPKFTLSLGALVSLFRSRGDLVLGNLERWPLRSIPDSWIQFLRQFI